MSQATATATPQVISAASVAETTIRGLLTSQVMVDIVGYFLLSVSQNEISALQRGAENWKRQHPGSSALDSPLPEAMVNAIKAHARSIVIFGEATQVSARVTSIRDLTVRNISRITPPSPPTPVAAPVVAAPVVVSKGYSPEERAAFRKKQHELALQRKAARQQKHALRVAEATERKRVKAEKQASREQKKGNAPKATAKSAQPLTPEKQALRRKINVLNRELGQLRRTPGIGTFPATVGRDNALVWRRGQGTSIVTCRLVGLTPVPPKNMVRLARSASGLCKNPFDKVVTRYTYVDAVKKLPIASAT